MFTPIMLSRGRQSADSPAAITITITITITIIITIITITIITITIITITFTTIIIIIILHTCHILPPSEIDLGLCFAAFAGSGGKSLFHRIGWQGRICPVHLLRVFPTKSSWVKLSGRLPIDSTDMTVPTH